MNRKKLKEGIVRRLIKNILSESQPATAPKTKPEPSTKPGPAVHPGRPDTDKKQPRRPLGNPGKKPETIPAKAGLKEEEMLQRIVKRYSSKNKK